MTGFATIQDEPEEILAQIFLRSYIKVTWTLKKSYFQMKALA